MNPLPPPNTLQMMTFLNPLDTLIPKIPFSFFADFWVRVTSGVRVFCLYLYLYQEHRSKECILVGVGLTPSARQRVNPRPVVDCHQLYCCIGQPCTTFCAEVALPQRMP